MNVNQSKKMHKFHGSILIPLFELRALNILGKNVTDSNDLFAFLTFNIAYDPRVFLCEGHRSNLNDVYLFLSYTDCRSAELVKKKKKKPSNES